MLSELHYASELTKKVALVDAKETYVIAGRGSAKSTEIIAGDLDRRFHDMPGAVFGLVGSTYTQVQQRTLASTISGLARKGYKEDKHWKIGRPKKSWGKPLFQPLSWDRWISIYTGCGLVPMSLDRPGLSNSYTVWKLYGDESKTFDYQLFQEDVVPTLRGAIDCFPNNPHNRGIMLCTSMPSLPEGQWLLDMEKRMNPELVETIYELAQEIEVIRYQYYTTKSSHVKDKLFKEIEIRTKNLNILRKYCVHYIEASSLSNIDILGGDYILQQYDVLGEGKFLTEIMNIRPKGTDIMFYNGLGKRNFYSAYDYDGYIDSFGLFHDERSVNWRRDKDYNPSLPLLMGFDFGVKFNGGVICQYNHLENKFRVLFNFYVENGGTIEDALNKFNDYYKGVPYPQIYLYYDNAGNNRNGIIVQTAAEQLENLLMIKGWSVQRMTKGGANTRHYKKFFLYEKILNDKMNKFPQLLINSNNCDELITSMRFAKAKKDKKGMIQKDKSSEQKLYIHPRHATHLSDALDDVFYDVISEVSTQAGAIGF